MTRLAKTIKSLAIAAALAVVALPSSAEQIKFAMSTPTDTNGNGVYVWIEAFKEALAEQGMEITVFPNGSLGGDQERMDQMRLDLLEMNVTNPDEISRYSPTFYGLAAPFLFESYGHMDRFLENTPFIDRVNQELGSQGFRFVDIAYTGAMVGLLTKKIPVRSISDLQKIRLRFLSAPDLKLFAAWGVRGVQVSWSEVAQALQTGMVDGYLNPPAVATMFGHGSVLDYFTDLRMGPSGRMIVVSSSWLNRLSDTERAAFERAVQAAHLANREWNRTYIEKERGALEKAGIAWIEPSASERSGWIEKTVNFFDEKWYDPDKTAQVEAWIQETATEASDAQ